MITITLTFVLPVATGSTHYAILWPLCLSKCQGVGNKQNLNSTNIHKSVKNSFWIPHLLTTSETTSSQKLSLILRQYWLLTHQLQLYINQCLAFTVLNAMSGLENMMWVTTALWGRHPQWAATCPLLDYKTVRDNNYYIIYQIDLIDR